MAPDGSGTLRTEAANLAFAMMRFAQVAAHPPLGSCSPGAPEVGTDAFRFAPSWRSVPRDEVVPFLVALPCPALLEPTLSRGTFVLTLVDELTGDRRRWAEKTLSNFDAGLAELSGQLGLSDTARVLVEFDAESYVFSLAAVRHYATHFPVNAGIALGPLDGDGAAEACLRLMRADGRDFPGRSSMIGGRERPIATGLGAMLHHANHRILVEGDLDAVSECFATSYRGHGTDRDLRGRAAVRRYVSQLRRAFPDLAVEVEILVEHGDRIAWQRTLRGTQRGAYKGFPATGRRVIWRDMVTTRFERGLVAEDWVVTDLAARLLLGRKKRR